MQIHHAREFPSPTPANERVHFCISLLKALRKAGRFDSGRGSALRPGALGSNQNLELTSYKTPDVYLTKTREPTKY